MACEYARGLRLIVRVIGREDAHTNGDLLCTHTRFDVNSNNIAYNIPFKNCPFAIPINDEKTDIAINLISFSDFSNFCCFREIVIIL